MLFKTNKNALRRSVYHYSNDDRIFCFFTSETSERYAFMIFLDQNKTFEIVKD